MNDTLLDDWRKLLAIGPEKLDVFRQAARDLGKQVAEGRREKPAVVDDLISMARAHGLFGCDEKDVEAVIAEGLELGERDQEDEVDRERLYAEADEKAGRARKGNGHDRLDPAPRALPLTFFNDLTESPSPKPWLIKGVLARDETSSWIAPPGKGKSSLLTDIAVYQGGGLDWRGFRTKGRSGVVYFALERADLVRRRLIAHKLRDGLRDLPIAVVSQTIDLLNRNCVDIIVATIQEAEQRFGCEVGLVIFDTYSKGIAAGGGDEDKAKDQNIVQANLRRVFDRGRHVHIAGIGHTGKDESKGERGSNARLADVDMQVQITGDPIKTVTIKKANDQPEGVLTTFQLEPFDFGPDEDGDSFRTFILSREIFAAGERSASRQKLSDRQVLALRALAEVALSQGRDPPAEYRLPPGIKVVDAEPWRRELLRCNALDRTASNPSARFRELRDGLAARSLIGAKDDLVWATRDHSV